MSLLSVVGVADGPVVHWPFEDSFDGTVAESVSGIKDRIKGKYKFIPGLKKEALRFDGFTTSVTREAAKAPKLGDSFTIEAWVALGAYPWNWVPIVSQADFGKRGYYFGIDSQGRFGFCFAAGGKWHECKTDVRAELKDRVGPKVDLELRKWYHLAVVFSGGKVSLYKNGSSVASLVVEGKIEYAPEFDVLIGRNREAMAPTHPVRDWATYPSWYSYDGLIDEVKMYYRVLSVKEIGATYNAHKEAKKPRLEERRFPSVESTGRFGAFYTKLKYYKQWDELWPVSDVTDIVVQFDEHPINVMFWRGSRYSPCWVTENGKWMADQSREVGSNWNLKKGPRTAMPTGCCEHMSDAQCRHSHVRVIENTDARVVVHWRYALLDVLYRQAGVDPVSGWGYWADELYTIYPDGVGVRHVLPGRGGWQETIFLNEPGTRPEDNCELEAITLVNLEGESKSYSWEKGYPKFDLADPVIQMTILKSQYKPFLIFLPGSGMSVFNVEVRPDYSHFPWWNHWPVAQVISDGRHCQAADRAASSSLVWGDPKGEAALYGLTNKPAVELLALAKSWSSPPLVIAKGIGAVDLDVGVEYDYKQRAFVVRKDKDGAVEFEILASEDSPVFNPCFVVESWGGADAEVKINGRSIKRGKDLRIGHHHTLDGTNLIVWIKAESTKPMTVSLRPKK
jgi:hypothetical protein